MISAAFFRRLARQHAALETGRRELQRLAADAQRLAKQAIFSRQREDGDTAQTQLTDAAEILSRGLRMTEREPRLAAEGSWRAALEEYAEARLFTALVDGETFEPEPCIDDAAILIGGLSDAIGEIARYAVRCATFGRPEEADALSDRAEELVGFITALDLTGSLRSKGDQARQHLRRLEELRYDLSRRGR